MRTESSFECVSTFHLFIPTSRILPTTISPTSPLYLKQNNCIMNARTLYSIILRTPYLSPIHILIWLFRIPLHIHALHNHNYNYRKYQQIKLKYLDYNINPFLKIWIKSPLSMQKNTRLVLLRTNLTKQVEPWTYKPWIGNSPI